MEPSSRWKPMDRFWRPGLHSVDEHRTNQVTQAELPRSQSRRFKSDLRGGCKGQFFEVPHIIMRSLIAASKSSSHQFLCLTAGRFFVPTGIPPAPRGAAVNDGRRPPAQPARSVIDGGEHGADPEVGRARPRRTVSILGIVEVDPAGIMVLSEVDTRPPHHGFRGVVMPQCEDANCAIMVVSANNA